MTAHPVKILPNYTYHDRKHWVDRCELIDGMVFFMNTASTGRHERIAGTLRNEFAAACMKIDMKYRVASESTDYLVDDHNILQPDILVVRDDNSGSTLALVVEILSPSTALKDRSNKFYIYEAQKIPYYLIVDTDTNTAEIYKLNPGQNYQPEQFEAVLPYTFQLESECHIEVTLNNIWQ